MCLHCLEGQLGCLKKRLNVIALPHWSPTKTEYDAHCYIVLSLQQHGKCFGKCHLRALQEWVCTGWEDCQQQWGAVPWALLCVCPVLPAVSGGAFLWGKLLQQQQSSQQQQTNNGSSYSHIHKMYYSQELKRHVWAFQNLALFTTSIFN